MRLFASLSDSPEHLRAAPVKARAQGLIIATNVNIFFDAPRTCTLLMELDPAKGLLSRARNKSLHHLTLLRLFDR